MSEEFSQTAKPAGGERLPRLSTAGGQPTYRRLYDAFRRAILAGHLRSGERLPSSRSLAAYYGVARNTALQAYDQLLAEGYVVGRRGSGTFVADELPDQFFSAVALARPKIRPSNPAAGVDLAPDLPIFSTGIPDLSEFPRELWLKLYSRYLRASERSLSAYGHEMGYGPLKTALAAYLNTHRGLSCSSEQIFILSGSQAGIDAAARCLVGPGDVVAVENPSYRGTVASLRLAGARVEGVAVDAQGLDAESLRRMAQTPRLVVATPSRQFPSGVAMPVARRLELLAWAVESRSWILEDDYDSEFRFKGNPLPAMQGLDAAGRTLYLGTFSKSMFPDLRLGYLVAPPVLVNELAPYWRASSGNPPVALQAALAAFLEEGHYLRHLRRMRKLYAERGAALDRLCRERLGDWLELGPTDGGLHFVAYLRRPWSGEAICREGSRRGLALFPLSRYWLPVIGGGDPQREGLMLGFAAFAEARLEKGVEQLRALLLEHAPL